MQTTLFSTYKNHRPEPMKIGSRFIHRGARYHVVSFRADFGVREGDVCYEAVNLETGNVALVFQSEIRP